MGHLLMVRRRAQVVESVRRLRDADFACAVRWTRLTRRAAIVGLNAEDGTAAMWSMSAAMTTSPRREASALTVSAHSSTACRLPVSPWMLA